MKSKSRISHRILSLVLVFVMLFVITPVTVFAAPEQTVLDISQGNIEIGDGTVSGYAADGTHVTEPNSSGYIITGTSDAHNVKVTDGTHNITLQNAIINSDTASPFDIASGANVTLTLIGENELHYTGDLGTSSAGLHVPKGAALTIGGTGKLSAQGQGYSAGIGASKYEVNGAITINNGIINATGNSGIGLAYYHSSYSDYNETGETITINGGTITAKGLSGNSAGIGGGSSAGVDYFDVGPIRINGGTIIAQGGQYNTVDIGGGTRGFVNPIIVTGGTINGRIGPGKNGSGSNIKNGNGEILTAKTIILSQITSSTAITAITLSDGSSYGINDMNTQNINNLYLYLPSDVTVNEIKTANATFAVADDGNYYCTHEGHEDKREVADNNDAKTHTVTYTDGCFGTEKEDHSWDSDKMECIYCHASYPRISVTTTDNNTVTYHATLKDAVVATSTYTNSTLTLLESVTLTDSQEFESGTFIIDLNGNTLSAKNNEAISVGSDAILTVQDNGSDGKFNVLITLEAGSTTNITGGIFEREGTAFYYLGEATVNLSGGIFTKGIKQEANTGVDTPSINSMLADGYFLRNEEGELLTVGETETSVNGYNRVSSGADFSTEAVITLDETEYTYDGVAKTPAVTVKVGGKTLIKDTDYIVTYANNINANTENTVPTVTVAAKTGSVYTDSVEIEFTIQPMPVTLTWNGSVFYYTGEEYNITAENDCNVEVTISGGTQTDVGIYTATASIQDTNYVINGSTEHGYEIKWYDQAPDATVSGSQGDNGWYIDDVTLRAPDTFTISKSLDSSYDTSITLTESAETMTYYLKQDDTGYIAQKTINGIMIDKDAPLAEIVVSESKWDTFLNNITFNLFFKETQMVTINVDDRTSDVVKIEYLVLEEEKTVEELNAMSWTSYSEALSINPNSKNIIYARVTDEAGHQSIVNSEGVVVYTDSTLNKENKTEIVYTKTQNTAQSFDVNLNGNTVAYIKINDTLLTKDTDYEVSDLGMISIDADTLEALSAGEYTVTVGFNPMDEVYVMGDAPAEVTIPLKVLKADVSIEIADLSKVYDSTPVNVLYQISKSSDSSPAASVIQYNEKVEYKVQGADDSTYETTVPESAGKYTVRITIDETDLIQSAVVTKDFEIEKKTLRILGATVEETKVYDGSTDALITSTGLVDGVIDVDDVSLNTNNARADYDNADVGTSKTIIFSGFALNGADAENYQLLQPAAVTADITVKDITGGVITLGDYPEYSGKPQTQPVKSVVIDGLDVTCDVTGNVQTEVGFYTLTITANGNFTGTLCADYRIVPQTSLLDDLTKDNVTTHDKAELEELLESIDTYLESGKLPEDEKEALKDYKKKTEVMLDIIENVEAVEDLINKLPENITKDDEDAIKAADDAYNELTDYEKSLVDEAVKRALADAKEALAELNKSTDTHKPGTSPNTGDNCNIWLWFALLVFSGAGIFGITITDHKRKTATKR